MRFSTRQGLTILELPGFMEEADRLFAPEELDDLRTMLAFYPEAGVIIRGAGGIRKLRWGLQQRGRGKRGGARIIYYYHSITMPLALLAVYFKGEKLDLTRDEKRELRNIVSEYVACFIR